MNGDQLFVLALIGLLVTPVVSIVLRVMDSRERQQVAQEARKEAAEARLARAEVKAAVDDVGKKADAAYEKSESLVELGNHHNDKLAAVLEKVETLQKAVIKTSDATGPGEGATVQERIADAVQTLSDNAPLVPEEDK